MPSGSSARRVVAFTTLISMPLAFGSLLAALLAVNFDFTAFDDPASQVGIGSAAAHLVYWSMILDLFGYYLLLAPAVLFLWYWLRPRSAYLAALYTLAGLGYVLIGAVGAAILAAVWPPLIRAYSDAGADQPHLATLFQALTNLVYGGLWNRLELLLAGIWWLGIGLLLRTELRRFSAATILLGVASLMDAAGNILGLPALASAGLFGYLALGPLWALWLGLLVLHGAGPSEEALGGDSALDLAPM